MSTPANRQAANNHPASGQYPAPVTDSYPATPPTGDGFRQIGFSDSRETLCNGYPQSGNTYQRTGNTRHRQAEKEALRLPWESPPQNRGGGQPPELDLTSRNHMILPPPLYTATLEQQAMALQHNDWAAIDPRARPPQELPPAPLQGPQLRVDWPSCKAHGLCHELLPEAIQVDEWGYPMLESYPLPAHLVSNARRAVAACPALALRLVN